MIGKNFIYDGVAIPYTAAQGAAAGWYMVFDWTTPSTSNFETPRSDFHGSISKPTFARSRLIEVKGEIFNVLKTGRGSAKNTIANLFKIQDFPSESNELRDLQFTDDDNTDWVIPCKVYTMPDYTHEKGDSVIYLFFQLYAPNPLIRSAALQTVSGQYGLLGGVSLPVELPAALFGTVGAIEVVNDGNFAAPATITITGEITNPKIINLTTGRYFQINETMNAGDVLVLDTERATAKLNGVNILASRADGSNWLYVNSGTNYFLLAGDNFDFDNQDKAVVDIDYYHTKLV